MNFPDTILSPLVPYHFVKLNLSKLMLFLRLIHQIYFPSIFPVIWYMVDGTFTIAGIT